MSLRYNVKQSPVESYTFEGIVNMDASRQSKWRNSTRVGQVREGTGQPSGIRQESCENGIRGLGEGRTLRSEGSRVFDVVKIPNPFQAILGSGRILSLENGDSVVSFWCVWF